MSGNTIAEKTHFDKDGLLANSYNLDVVDVEGNQSSIMIRSESSQQALMQSAISEAKRLAGGFARIERCRVSDIFTGAIVMSVR